jgi:hypothetical protein
MNKTLSYIFILILIYLLITNSKGVKNLLTTIIGKSTQGIKTLQGR